MKEEKEIKPYKKVFKEEEPKTKFIPKTRLGKKIAKLLPEHDKLMKRLKDA